MAVRLSTLAEIKVLSLGKIIADSVGTQSDVNQTAVTEALGNFRNELDNLEPAALQALKDNDSVDSLLFETIGVAQTISINEDYGTTNIYGIGAPTRPRIVPNNYNVAVDVAKLTLDTSSLDSYVTTPEYWYSHEVQRHVGIDDVLLYTFLFIYSKEKNDKRADIYALMPRSARKSITNNDVLIVEDVSMVGFKYSYEQAFFDTTNLIDNNVTERSVF